ncbi:class I SAM-dependent methyltransferase [Peribacillus saganii]|uniref:Class I SAM-dependent methyltransferase n=1 Tax=Peribacillus saganii TaxID=2303992 RepID=A0A372LU03_9BACI|nr:class I SAM-dependent methyltransferase [Peribacillus saganii]RFU71658.1 class I SAM-dependent methyltransferase [Peribacillus saganii]
MAYDRFAYVYDELMKEAPYDKWLSLLLSRMSAYHIQGNEVLDLACGTGEFTIELARHGLAVKGVDLSADMLSVAQEKAVRHGYNIPFFQQNMAELEGLGKNDCVTIFCDSLNYLQQESDVLSTFRQVHAHLKENGLFMFDVHTVYKIEQIFKDNTFTLNEENIAYIWNSYGGTEPFSVEHELTFFVQDDVSGQYDRFDEVHYQRTYHVEVYEKWLNEAGFEVMEVMSDLEEVPVHRTTERVLFVARKI